MIMSKNCQKKTIKYSVNINLISATILEFTRKKHFKTHICNRCESYLDFSDDLGVHKIENPSKSVPLLSLHLYSPPFGACSVSVAHRPCPVFVNLLVFVILLVINILFVFMLVRILLFYPCSMLMSLSLTTSPSFPGVRCHHLSQERSPSQFLFQV